MNITITHENLADHPDYDDEVQACGSQHGLSVRQWRDSIWFCGNCGHRVCVKVQGQPCERVDGDDGQ